jgi:hypothetical protein
MASFSIGYGLFVLGWPALFIHPVPAAGMVTLLALAPVI